MGKAKDMAKLIYDICCVSDCSMKNCHCFEICEKYGLIGDDEFEFTFAENIGVNKIKSI